MCIKTSPSPPIYIYNVNVVPWEANQFIYMYIYVVHLILWHGLSIYIYGGNLYRSCSSYINRKGDIASDSRYIKKYVSKHSCFFGLETDVLYGRTAGRFFFSSGAHFHGKHGCSWNVIAQRATLQDFKSRRFLLLKRRWEKVGVEHACVSCCSEKTRRKRARASRL